MRLLCALVLFVFAAAAFLPAAEPITATMAKRGNVRFGPSDKAPISTTLPPGTQVEILGAVQRGNETWYQIRFPRQGKAWIHQMNLQKIDEKQYKVTAKANVRDDATNGANIVSSVEPGDVVEYQGSTVGMFLMVYPPRAVAYVSAKVLNLPAAAPGQEALQVPVAQTAQKPVERLWLTAKQTYASYAAIASDKNQQAKAQTLDWSGLSRQLGEVASNHPETEAKLQAGRFKSGVDEVVSHLQRLGIKPSVTVPEPPAAPSAPLAPVSPVAQPPVAQPPVAQPQPVIPPAQPPVAPQPGAQPPVAPQPPVAQPPVAQPDAAGALANLAREATAAKAFAVEGFLEQRADAYVVLDSNSRVVGMLKLKAGSTVPLSEYFWRLIGVSGQQDGSAKDDEGRDVPVILVDDVALIGK